MANKDHLALLINGVAAWNEWRKKNPEIQPDLSRANLYVANLRGADLSVADLRGAHLIEADFHGADLFSAKLIGANFPWDGPRQSGPQRSEFERSEKPETTTIR